MKHLHCLFILIVILASGFCSQAAVISVQFSATPAADLSPSQSAGFMPATNWNVEAIVNGAAFQTGNFSNLVDSTGATTTLSGTWSAGFTFGVQGSYSVLSPDNQLLSSKLGTFNDTVTVNLADIPYDEYNVIVYLAGNSSSTETGTLTLGGSSSVSLNDAVAQLGAPVVFTSAAPGPGNYVEFSGLTGATQSITYTGTNFGGIAGFQIVAIPEPATSSTLILLGLIGCAASRRVRRSA